MPSQQRRILKYDSEGNFIKEYSTIKEACDECNIRREDFARNIKKFPNRNHNYILRYKDEYKRVNRSCINYSYDIIKNAVEKKGCRVLISKIDFETEFKKTGKRMCETKFEIECICGHNKITNMQSFIKLTYYECSSCSKSKIHQKITLTNTSSDGSNLSNLIEHNGYLFLKSLLCLEFDITRLDEGTDADILCKPKFVEDDKWIKVQLKNTEKQCQNDKYYFSTKRKYYKGMIIVCACVKDCILWLIDPEVVKNMVGISISVNPGTKYDKYKCDISDICGTFFKLYNNDYYTKVSIESCNVPISWTTKIEKTFRELRIKNLDFIKFEKLDIPGSCTDFIVNGKKVQEKVSNKTIKSSTSIYITFGLFRHIKKKLPPYLKGDNDLYWFHLPIENLFYMIPETKLIEHGYIGKKAKISISLYPFETTVTLKTKGIMSWFANEFMFDYNNLDRSKLSILFDLQ